MLFCAHVAKTISACFGALRQIRSIRRSVTQPQLKSVIVSLVLPRLDYCIVLLHDLPKCQLARLQSVLHAAAGLVFRLPRSAHVSRSLMDLRWLPVQSRIQLRLAIITLTCLNGSSATYLQWSDSGAILSKVGANTRKMRLGTKKEGVESRYRIMLQLLSVFYFLMKIQF